MNIINALCLPVVVMVLIVLIQPFAAELRDASHNTI